VGRLRLRASGDIAENGVLPDNDFVKTFCTILLAFQLTLTSCQSYAGEIRVAAASNFRSALSALATQFEQTSEHQVTLIFGSTGKHFAQIMNGAPYDLFFAADSERPRRLEEEHRAVPGSRFTYARGKLVLWSPKPGYVDSRGEILDHGNFRHLAIANPTLAPYGEAAREVLISLGYWQQLSTRLVRGENVGQTFLFVSSGNAELGFVAWPQLLQKGVPTGGSYWLVPANLYRPIEQQAVLLNESEAAHAFVLFIRSSKAASIIRAHGYDIAE
jgi:molybdate transport system substrate-binding protein